MVVDGDDFEVARALEKHVDGSTDEFRVVAHVGEKRAQALHASGRDSEVLDLSSQAGDVEGQITAYVRETRQRHERGPRCYCWFVLRKNKATGNVAISHAVPIGGGTELEVEASAGERALAEAIKMGPLTLQLMVQQNKEFLSMIGKLFENHLEARVAIADMNARAEAADETAKWEAVAESVKELGPMARQGLEAWINSRGMGAAPDVSKMTAEDFAQLFNKLPDSAKAEFAGELVAAWNREKAARAAQNAPPPSDDGEDTA